MPLISEFYGISVYMYYEDHNPPHFHASYAGKTILVDIINGCVLQGCLPSKQVKLVLAWCEIHRDELVKNWELSKASGEILSIEPLK